MNISIFWFRRDLRLEDNVGLYNALKESPAVQPIFIFDREILQKLANPQDARVLFIYQNIAAIKKELNDQGTDLWVFYGEVLEVFKKLTAQNKITSVFCNHDYEPAAINRDKQINDYCANNGIEFKTYKDQVIFEKSEVLTDQNKPYTVFTPYKKKWLANLSDESFKSLNCKKLYANFNPAKKNQELITLQKMGFARTEFAYFPQKKLAVKLLQNYGEQRNFPAVAGTSLFGVHLRFGTISIRNLAAKTHKLSEVFLSELIWREFFMQILFHFPRVVTESFRPEYDKIEWRNNNSDFERWCAGQTGYPIVDAGMRQLNETGFMHNRVRMIVGSFLTKHLLIHWSQGERYFARHLLDYDLSANNGNWQWVAGTGCDAAPYFRVFNPEMQTEKFDPDLNYIKKWVPEFQSSAYPKQMVDHKFARVRAIREYSKAVKERKLK